MKHSYRQLEVFVAVARLGSVSRAADGLAMSQSAASTALMELERQFDTRLFDRVGKAMKLNSLGAELLPAAIDILDRARQLEEALGGHLGFGQLKVGATLTIGNYLATLVAAQFLRAHPHSHVQLEVRNTAAIVAEVANFDLDLGLIEGQCNDPRLERTPWVKDRLAVFCAPGHPLAGRGAVAAEELLAHPWILREPGSGTRLACEAAFGERFHRLPVRLELEHTEAIKRAVEAGLGIGCLSRLALKDACRRGSLVAVDCPELDLERQFWFVWHRQKFQTAAMREFLALCREMTAEAEYSHDIPLPAVP